MPRNLTEEKKAVSQALTVAVEGLEVAGEDYVDSGKVMATFVSVQS